MEDSIRPFSAVASHAFALPRSEPSSKAQKELTCLDTFNTWKGIQKLPRDEKALEDMKLDALQEPISIKIASGHCGSNNNSEPTIRFSRSETLCQPPQEFPN